MSITLVTINVKKKQEVATARYIKKVLYYYNAQNYTQKIRSVWI